MVVYESCYNCCVINCARVFFNFFHNFKSSIISLQYSPLYLLSLLLGLHRLYTSCIRKVYIQLNLQLLWHVMHAGTFIAARFSIKNFVY